MWLFWLKICMNTFLSLRSQSRETLLNLDYSHWNLHCRIIYFLKALRKVWWNTFLGKICRVIESNSHESICELFIVVFLQPKNTRLLFLKNPPHPIRSAPLWHHLTVACSSFKDTAWNINNSTFPLSRNNGWTIFDLSLAQEWDDDDFISSSHEGQARSKNVEWCVHWALLQVFSGLSPILIALVKDCWALLCDNTCCTVVCPSFYSPFPSGQQQPHCEEQDRATAEALADQATAEALAMSCGAASPWGAEQGYNHFIVGYLCMLTKWGRTQLPFFIGCSASPLL